MWALARSDLLMRLAVLPTSYQEAVIDFRKCGSKPFIFHSPSQTKSLNYGCTAVAHDHYLQLPLDDPQFRGLGVVEAIAVATNVLLSVQIGGVFLTRPRPPPPRATDLSTSTRLISLPHGDVL